MTDSKIIDLILKGDKAKFRFIVEKYQQMVFRTCIGFLHNKDDANDLTQDIFIQVYQSLRHFKGDSAFSTWLYRIAVNAALNKVRKSPLKLIFQRFEHPVINNEKEIYQIATTEENPENLLIRLENSKWIQDALDSLTENQRAAIVLSKYDDLPQKEIASIMQTTEGAVEALLQRAKKNLREKLSFHPKNK